ncbi:glycosyl hydrolase [Thermoclostridium stercorarium subsp. leptospartum DSM 9219]|uniref:Glycosyl hydrolase n=1 Tax=Thermoclostridium stercorarium subsp. leptospartum DSM 9219 TaxID=1346611 RepID=A0A1B1YI04_THEST|nr:glycoside hydrolase family 3 C-terminal domain-containing protein [Thermoclostridium stercorarium]ANX00396.1 glycosyl hydrolase [Thermoclostridium stercorarium subsp. leptospartum DSM 9219]
MTLKEKIALCEGKNFWETRDFPQYGIPSIFMCDGPHGLRKQEVTGREPSGVNESRPATCFPAAVSTACSWDEELLGKIGAAIAEEALDQGVGVFLGPGVNIKRNPLCGRNFEYFSEDPYLAGKLAASYIKNAQKNGIATCVKHFACNNQEYRRFNSDSVIDERTLREIYLTPFEIAVREGRPKAVMCAYNKINGVYCSDNKVLLTDILRNEWGFEGVVITDWGAMNDRIAAFKAGCDLNMPGGSNYMEQEVLDAVARGELSEAEIDRSAERIKKMVREAYEVLGNRTGCDYNAHHELARIAAEQSAVLLKNEDDILPLKEWQKIAIVGDMAGNMRYQGSGSSHINPTKLVQPADVLKSRASVEEADVAVVFAGLPPEYESEGFDRDSMEMPPEQVRLIEETAAKNPNTVVVLFCGAPVETPWADRVKGILYMGLPGQAGGEAVKNLLYGIANPSGKLAETWPIRYSDCPSAAYYPQRDGQYREGIYVGYRYYDKANVRVRWKFGFGLSYTEFAYSNPQINGETVKITVTNTGKRAGAEVVQLYIAPPHDGIHRPVKELKRFAKVFLTPGENREISFTLDNRCFAVWDGGWKVPEGKYTVLVGGNPDKLTVAGVVEKAGEKIKVPYWQPGSWYEKPFGPPPLEQWEKMIGSKYVPYTPQKGNFTMNDTLAEMKKYSFIMRILYWYVKISVTRGMKRGTAEYRMMVESSVGSPLRNLQISGGMSGKIFRGLLAIANGKYIKGLRTLLKKDGMY